MTFVASPKTAIVQPSQTVLNKGEATDKNLRAQCSKSFRERQVRDARYLQVRIS